MRYYRDNWRSLCDGVEITRDYSPEPPRQAAEMMAGGLGSLDWKHNAADFSRVAELDGHSYRLEVLDGAPDRPIARAPTYRE